MVIIKENQLKETTDIRSLAPKLYNAVLKSCREVAIDLKGLDGNSKLYKCKLYLYPKGVQFSCDEVSVTLQDDILAVNWLDGRATKREVIGIELTNRILWIKLNVGGHISIHLY